jgi:hypothetical protein
MLFPKDKRIKLSKTKLNKVREYVFERDESCVNCGTFSVPQLAHVVGRGAGGNDSPNNLVQLCGIKPDLSKGCHPKFDQGEIDLPGHVYSMLKSEPLYLS